MTDWDAAYDNRATIENAEAHLDKWKSDASAFRDAMLLRLSCDLSCPYADKPRNTYDLFYPQGQVNGTVIFIHGGYWRALDSSYFSHLATGPLMYNWQVAIPSYTLAPQARIYEITQEVARAIETIAEKFDGPIRLAGHSAGGHLVARMLCDDSGLPFDVYSRIVNTVAISGLFDLRHLPETKMNLDLQLDDTEVETESPVHHQPRPDARINCLVGGNELKEFLRQNDVLDQWKVHGAKVKSITDHGKNHFTVVEALGDPNSLLTTVLMN